MAWLKSRSPKGDSARGQQAHAPAVAQHGVDQSEGLSESLSQLLTNIDAESIVLTQGEGVIMSTPGIETYK